MMNDKSNLLLVAVAAVIAIHIGIIVGFAGYKIAGYIMLYGGVAVVALSTVRIVYPIDAEREKENSCRSHEIGEEETRSE